MKRMFLIVMLLLSARSMAQPVPPDNDAILGTIIDGASPYYYRNIFPRYMAGDTTLTVNDYYYLYYGYVFQDEYKPLESIPAQDKVLMALSGGEPKKEDFEKVVESGLEVMKADPFSPGNINFLTYAYGMLGDTVNERINADRFGKIIAAIGMSGDGLTEETPWHILWFSHGKDMMVVRGLNVARDHIVSKDVVYMMMPQKDAAGNKGYYFDYSRIYLKKPEGYDDRKRVEGLEFKGWKSK